ncbi:FHA domain-containing protein [Arthrobacter sp. ISL-65]|uniref:FHA domain-containing protein n=1 Tax=Arthrobacter sp. ISL-65 TaxID=2819112 RepID=UPI001BEA9AF5|nr:FHA domain-containing protein [Arthrobacter sp. ISL-65]MBT2548505.1 FHA domain-containing protein [Arthrobacter sp. ISL-65]
MAAASYVPGGWLGLIRSGTAVILDPATPAPLVSTVWDLLEKSPDAAEVLHAVTGGFGAPLSASPWFGIIGFSDSLRVFLRGDIDLTVQLPSGPVNLDGRNVTTWTERWLDAPEWFSVSAPAGAASRLSELPVVEGAVLLQSLRVSVAGSLRALPVGAPPAGALPGGTHTAAALPAGTQTAAALSAAPEAEPPYSEVSAETMVGLTEDASVEAEEPEAAAPAIEPPAQGDEHEPAAELTGSATEFTSSYDHLWDKTVVRSIEDAAVRTGEEDDGGTPATRETAVPDTAVPETVDQETADQETTGQDAESQEARQPVITRAAAAPAPPSAPSQAGLIDSVPWATGGDRAPGSEVPAPFSEPQVPSPFTGPQVPPSFISMPASRDAAEGDHDGQTILKSDLPASGAQQAGHGPEGGQGTEPGQGAMAGNGPLVLARACPGGHANPPTSSQCFTCGMQLPDVAVQVPRPRLGRLRLSTGELIDLDESIVIGRQPSVSRVQGGTMPRLVQVASPGGDISRSHVEVRLEGWHVMLCDLKATNGTVLVREGQPPRRLAQNEMAIILDGDIAELGDDVSLRFEEIL